MNQLTRIIDSWRSRMTDDMREVTDAFTANLEEEFQLCCQNYIAARKAARPEPGELTTEGQAVMPGAILTVKDIEKYWLGRLELLLKSGVDELAFQEKLGQHPDPIIRAIDISKRLVRF